MMAQTPSRKTRFLCLLAATTVLTPLCLAGPAFAEGADAATDADGATAVGEVIVTATRRAESIQKVPISVQALGAEKMQERQVKGLSDLVTLLPSVSFAGLGPGRQTTYFRGIVPAGGTYASVGYYLDDIPITGTGVPDIHVYDLERVEALSGPQGTLYGAGSLAGTIRFITNKPKIGVFEAGYDLEVNKYGPGDAGGQIESYVNVPVSDSFALRGVAFFRREGGYVDNVPNNGLLNDGRSAVLTLGDNNPATSFTLDNSAIAENDYNTVRDMGVRLVAQWDLAPGWEITPQLTAQYQTAKGYFGFDPRVGDLEVHDYDQTKNDDRWYQAQLSVHGHIGDWDLVSATGYHQRRTKLLNDYTYYTVTYDGFGPGYENYLQFFDRAGCTGTGATLRCTRLINPIQYFHGLTYRDKFTQEVRITTPDSWPFDVTAGAFYHWQKQENNTYYATRGLDQIAGYTRSGGGDTNFPAGFGVPTTAGGTMIVGTPAVKEDGFYIVENNQNYSDKALFAEGHYNITPTLKLTAGIRYFKTEYRIKGFAGVMGSAANTTTSLFVPTGARGCPTPLPAERLQCLNTNFAAADQVGRYKEDGETHKVALDWQFTPTKMVYVNYSTGFRPGGFNRPLRIRSIGVATVDPFKSETLTNYEVGIKTLWGDNFRFNAAAYYEEWNNIQYAVVVSGAQGAGITGNAGKARVYGLEYDADLKLGDVTISSSGAYNDAALDGNFCNFAFDAATLKISQLASCTLGATVPGSSPPTPQVAAANGTRLPRQPKFKGTTSIRYDTEWNDYTAFVQGAALYQTGATQDLNVFNNNLLGNTSGFVTFDFSGGVKKDNWTFNVFLQNAFDRRGILTRNTFCSITFCSGSSRAFPIKPQFFGARFGQKF